MNNRESAYSALFAKLSAISGIVTAERRLRHWSDVMPTEMPYLALAVAGQVAEPVKRLPTKWTLGADLYIYVQSDNSAPGPILNALLDKIDEALAPDPGQDTQTLGGIVSHAWIEGQVQTDEGTLGPIAVAIVPIRMLAS